MDPRNATTIDLNILHDLTPLRHLRHRPIPQPLLREPNDPKRLRHTSHPLRDPEQRLLLILLLLQQPLPHQHRPGTPLLQGLHSRIPTRPTRRSALQLGTDPERTQRIRARLAIRRRDRAE